MINEAMKITSEAEVEALNFQISTTGILIKQLKELRNKAEGEDKDSITELIDIQVKHQAKAEANKGMMELMVTLTSHRSDSNQQQ